MSSNGELEVAMSQQASAPSTTAAPQEGANSSNQYMPMPPDANYQRAFAGVSQGTANNDGPNQNMLRSQQHSEDGMAMGLQLDDEQRRLMMLRQNELSQLAARNPFVNQQLLMNPGSLEPLLAGASTTQIPANMNPEMLFAASTASGLRCPPNQFLLPAMTFSGGALAPIAANFQNYSMHALNSVGNVNGPTVSESGAQELPEDSSKSPAVDMPIRPLSAYNFFFRDERERVLKEGEDAGPSEETTENLEKKKKRLLEQHIQKDRTRRRPHRKTHGKIGFTTLSKLIGKRWRELPEEKKQYYRDVASMDMDRYQRDVAEYNKDRLYRKQHK